MKRALQIFKLHRSNVLGLVLVLLPCASLAQGGAPPHQDSLHHAVQTLHLTLEVTLSYAQEGSVMLEYRLTNVGTAPFVVDPADLQILYGEVELPYKLVHAPAPGRANRLSQGETASGTLTVSDPPHDSDNLLFMWSVLEIGPDTEHILLKRFGDMILKSSGAAVQTLGRRLTLSVLTLSVELQKRSGSPQFFYTQPLRHRPLHPQLLSSNATAGVAQTFLLAVDLRAVDLRPVLPSGYRAERWGSIRLRVSGRELA